MKRFSLLLLFLILTLFLLSLLTLISGDMPWEYVWNHFLERFSGASHGWNALLDERLPRLLVIICTGASLAVAGSVMQSLFQNALASPSVLGITAGGSLCVVLVFVNKLHFAYPQLIPLAAIGGCLFTLLFVYAIAKKQKQENSLNSIIVTGIAISAFLIAIQGAIFFAYRDQWQMILTLTEWESGTTANRSWQHAHMQLPLTIVGIWGCWYYRQEINIMTLGEEEAKNLGVETDKVRWRLFLSVSLLTGGALAAMGIIAFFGLILPNIFRRIVGPDNKLLLPICILGGSSVMLGLDLILRFFHIQALSIGNISAILGGIFFMALLFSPRYRCHSAGA